MLFNLSKSLLVHLQEGQKNSTCLRGCHKECMRNTFSAVRGYGRFVVSTLAFVICPLPTVWTAVWWRGTNMCLPMSTVHHTHSEMGSVIAQFEQYRDLPSKSLENSSGLTFLDYCALSLSLSHCGFFTIFMFAITLILYVGLPLGL